LNHCKVVSRKAKRLSWNFDNDNFNVLKESDIMISDFSGVIFDYTLIFDRPVIYADTDFDKAPYDAAWFEGDKPLLDISKRCLRSVFL
jgi:CDP-glycerol glycerophosphotransferase (TagB/SpsB family)